MPLPLIIPLAAAAAPAIYQGVKGLSQKNQAKKLKESNFVPPELLMNRDLAMQQAYSRRAPGQARAEENVRRNLATTISAGQRSFGGDANKIAAITAGANAQANDATARIADSGAQFSENAFARLAGTNTQIAAQRRQNRNEFNAAKAELIAAGDQNIFNSISNLSTLGLMAAGTGTGKGAKFASGTLSMQNPWMDMYQDPATGVWQQPSQMSGPSYRVAPRVNRNLYRG